MKMFGAAPAPWTISWSGEEAFFLGHCPYAQRTAILQHDLWGAGKPLFGKPHSQRQRKAIALMLCDLCALPLRSKTKVSLSQARPVAHSARGGEVLQVEPMVCKLCAVISIRHCPSLRRQIRDGVLNIRQVYRSAVQFAVMDEFYVETVTGVAGVTAVGHAKVQLIKWRDRDPEWLGIDRRRLEAA